MEEKALFVEDFCQCAIYYPDSNEYTNIAEATDKELAQFKADLERNGYHLSYNIIDDCFVVY